MGPSGLIISIVLLVFLSSFFSLAETAVVSTPEEKIFKMNEEGKKGARSALKVLTNKEKIVSIALLCDNLVNIAASSLSAVFFSDLFGQWDEIGILISTILMTMLIFIFGEVFPKMIALRQPTKITLIIAPLLLLLWKILYPIIWSINIVTSKIVSFLHIRNEQATEDVDETILGAVEMYHKKGMIESDERKMLSGILQLDETELQEIITRRNEMFAIDVNEKTEVIIDKIMNTGFTKIPFYDKTDDNMIGVLYTNDLMKALHNSKNDLSKINIRDLLHKPWFLPGNASVESHLKEFKRNSEALAFVVDEYGVLLGILTLEDVLEEIVGDIGSEVEGEDILKVESGFDIEADADLEEVNEKVGSNFKNDDVSSIGGFLIGEIDKIPQNGAKFEIGGYVFTILETTKTRIKKINIVKKKDDNADEINVESKKNTK